jgi:hypothetical protein
MERKTCLLSGSLYSGNTTIEENEKVASHGITLNLIDLGLIYKEVGVGVCSYKNGRVHVDCKVDVDFLNSLDWTKPLRFHKLMSWSDHLYRIDKIRNRKLCIGIIQMPGIVSLQVVQSITNMWIGGYISRDLVRLVHSYM